MIPRPITRHIPSIFLRHPIRSILFFLTFIGLLILSTNKPDPTSNKFQFPSLFPSRYPPPTSSSLLTNRVLSKLPLSFRQHCPRQAYDPVYPSPALTSSQERRYDHLRKPYIPGRTTSKYMFVTLTREIQSQLPDLLNTLVLLTSFLGPDRVSFSILEGPSDDCTPQVLEEVLLPTLLEVGVPRKEIHLKTREGKIDFSNVNRIETLAGLRNRALGPLFDERMEDVVAVVFFNDVFLRVGDVLEILHQHVKAGEESGLESGITAAMDYWQKRPEYYYDIWVGRTYDTGDLFYPISKPWWSPSSDLFHNTTSKSAYQTLQPFPVFSSWNGLVAMSPIPLLQGVRFRRGDKEKEECAASECTLIACDYWKFGWGRVQVVPSVQLAYEKKVALEIREDLQKQQDSLGWTDGVPPRQLDTVVQWPNG
ncbi:hypothetical protein M231_04753 [Tremella mesenterica]|uniref:Alpha-1,3-mannosyltransferase CMT1 n=1 Tax=Tremella mesenterica TaxID=5217 RepID=A0A4V1M3T3_TREME|nr:hypothetical protein M231_04753 [Tremella mesenterica]